MYTHNTNITEAPTLFQRFIARLNDPSPARYSGAIQLRTLGRVTLADSADASRPTVNAPRCESGIPCHPATPRTAA